METAIVGNDFVHNWWKNHMEKSISRKFEVKSGQGKNSLVRNIRILRAVVPVCVDAAKIHASSPYLAPRLQASAGLADFSTCTCTAVSVAFPYPPKVASAHYRPRRGAHAHSVTL